MTITYPQPAKTKRPRAALAPVGPTAALRADAALADAHRFLGAGMAQTLSAAMWALLLSNAIQHPLGVVWFGGVSALLFVFMAGFIWASMQGQGLQNTRYTSGLSHKVTGPAKYVMFGAFIAMGCGLLVPVGMFLAWERNLDFSAASGLMQLALLLGLVLLSVSLSLRAVEAIKYARAQLSEGDSSTELNSGAG
jgi:hypothetical protein